MIIETDAATYSWVSCELTMKGFRRKDEEMDEKELFMLQMITISN
jgi:hypothetical protein